ncbi:hypothetical protein CAEBREN_31621 [Caenorhabditis brenneri]|uniref:Acyltransferase 3 domain-containing protein n=1 Tax=Caenorhabditis brenneri TaxID=135651 RepID=G0NXC2_CAEBE|nr:hypothetical protein CAEBREN_31621 [Caenorhabditis brenneri]
MYFLAVFLIVVMVHLCLGDFLWPNNNRYSLASLFLVTNQLIIHDQADYFNEFLAATSSINGFLHLWSLSVEMQFYLFVPIIFFGIQFLKNDYLKMVTVSLITTFGFISFAMILDKFAFNFMFLRLWQFSAGFMALFWSKIDSNRAAKVTEHEETSSKLPFTKDDVVTVALSILALCILPKKVEVLVLRPVVTLTTALIIAAETKKYSVIIFVASILLHHIFEKQYLKLEMKGVFPLIFLLIASNAYLQYSVRNDSFWMNSFSSETREIVDKNLPLYVSLWDLEPRRDKCIETDVETPFAKSHLKAYCRFPVSS